MKNEEFININRDGWNKLISDGLPFANTSLPEYGPFLEKNEDTLNLFDNLNNAKVLDVGCASGNSLVYIKEKGAKEIWGIDISENQINLAKERFKECANNFIVSPMEDITDVPKDYFDFVFSIYSIGYTSDITSTLKNINSYLKKSGTFIFSWTHPFYFCLDQEDEKVFFKKSYFDENETMITKGPNKVNLMQKNLTISTLVNELNNAGFYIENIIEEKTKAKDTVNGYKSNFWLKEKAMFCPTTIIFKCIKK